MNGVHDMGGMDGFGRVMREPNEPVFHEGWERRVFAMALSVNARVAANVDEFRHAIERIPAPRYLDSSYYERWLDGLQTILIEKGALSREDLAERGADPVEPAQPSNRIKAARAKSARTRARFRVGDRVIARNLNPSGHTRLPRYVRGKRGVIRSDWGVYILADSNAHGAGENRQHVYSVAFEARELWGKDAPARDKLLIDLWEDYLEAAPEKRSAKKPAARTKHRRKR